MSYHTHNLRDGDVFASPADLDLYSSGAWTGNEPYHLFEVIDVEHATYMTPDFRWLSGLLDKDGWLMHIVARCLGCGEILNGVVDKYISLCMIAYGPEDGEPGYLEGPYEDGVTTLEEKARRWMCRR